MNLMRLSRSLAIGIALSMASSVSAQTLKAQFRPTWIGTGDNQLALMIDIVNTGSSAVALGDVTVRYYYTIDGAQSQSSWCDYTPRGCGNVTRSFGTVSPAAPTADTYLQFGFSSGAGNLSPGQSTGAVQLRVAKSDWSNYNDTNDYSYAGSSSLTDNSNITVYVGGVLVWGTPPGGGPTPDFSLSAAPSSVSVERGASAASTISIDRTNFPGTVSFSVSGLPSGVSATFAPPSTTGTGSTVTFTASSAAAIDATTVVITGSGGTPTITRTVAISLAVTGGGDPDFSLSASPGSVTVDRGATAASTIAISRTDFTSAVSFTTSALPAGVSASFSPPSTTGASTTVTFTATATATPGPVTVTISGSGGSPAITREVTIALTVLGGDSDFSLSASPAAVTVNRGTSVRSTITIARTNFTGAVTFTLRGLPAGVSASISPLRTTGNGTTVTFTASSTAPAAGPVDVVISGSGGSPTITRTVTISLTVGGGGDPTFSLSAAPTAVTVDPGATATSTITIARTNFPASVSFTATGLPSGVTASFSPPSTTGTSTVVTFAATSTAPAAGPVTVTISGSGGTPTITRSVTLALTVRGGPSDFSLSAAPTTVTVDRGATATSTIAIVRTNFASSVSFTATGLPSGVSASFSPPSTTGTSTVVTFTASSTATIGGPVTVTISGSGGSPAITRSVSIALTVSGGPSDFSLSASPTNVSVSRGATGRSTIAISRTNFPSSVSFTTSALPTGVSASFSPPSTTGTSTVVTFTASSTAPAAGPVTVTISGSGGTPAITRSVTIALTVTVGVSGWSVAGGKVTKNGEPYPVRCGSWFGLQGRYEPASDSANPRGAPMEQYVGNTFWANNHTRTLMQTMNEISDAGITVIRLPLVHQTLATTPDRQGDGSLYKNYSGIINDATYPMRNARQSLESMIKAADAVGIAVMLDIHSCSNYIDWRAGRFDARPPWADADRNDYDFKREDWSCAATLNPGTVRNTQPYNETIWLEDLRTLAGLPAALGVDNIIGIDIFNEPHDFTWDEWKTLTEHAYQAISAVNPDLLLFVQGIATKAGAQDGTPETTTPVEHGEEFSNPNWGENLYPAQFDLPDVPKEKLVWSPHTYGPSVFVQKMFMDPAQPECAGLEGDAVGDARCNIVINPDLLRPGWEEHFGYLKDLGYAIVVGEFGGNLDWPLGQASTRDRDRYSYLPRKTVDAEWQSAFVDYMVEREIEGCYWSINPESGDTGGWYGHAYDPISNTGGWGEWRAFDARKTTLLRRLWGM